MVLFSACVYRFGMVWIAGHKHAGPKAVNVKGKLWLVLHEIDPCVRVALATLCHIWGGQYSFPLPL